MVVYSFRLPIHFKIMGGQVHDYSAADDLLTDLPTQSPIGVTTKKACADGSIPMISHRCNSKAGNV